MIEKINIIKEFNKNHIAIFVNGNHVISISPDKNESNEFIIEFKEFTMQISEEFVDNLINASFNPQMDVNKILIPSQNYDTTFLPKEFNNGMIYKGDEPFIIVTINQNIKNLIRFIENNTLSLYDSNIQKIEEINEKDVIIHTQYQSIKSTKRAMEQSIHFNNSGDSFFICFADKTEHRDIIISLVTN